MANTVKRREPPEGLARNCARSPFVASWQGRKQIKELKLTRSPFGQEEIPPCCRDEGASKNSQLPWPGWKANRCLAAAVRGTRHRETHSGIN